MANVARGNRSSTACASTWAVEWRIVNSPRSDSAVTMAPWPGFALWAARSLVGEPYGIRGGAPGAATRPAPARFADLTRSGKSERPPVREAFTRSSWLFSGASKNRTCDLILIRDAL